MKFIIKDPVHLEAPRMKSGVSKKLMTHASSSHQNANKSIVDVDLRGDFYIVLEIWLTNQNQIYSADNDRKKQPKDTTVVVNNS